MPRTFSDEAFFRNNKERDRRRDTLEEHLGHEVLEAIQRICTAYSHRNVQIGYCQGFNFIIGRLLQVMTEEEAFWTFAALIESSRVLPLDYYQNLMGARVDLAVMAELMEEKFPRLAAKGYIEIVCIHIMNWFITLFANSLSFDVLVRLWDLLFIKGTKILFRFTLAIVHLQEEELLRCHDIVAVRKKLESVSAYLQDPVIVLQVASQP